MATTLQVIGGNLFQIALEQLGDATQWDRIAVASGTGIDPVLPTGVVTVLVIPAVDSSAGGGVYGV